MIIDKLKALSKVFGKTTKDGWIIEGIELSDNMLYGTYTLHVHMQQRYNPRSTCTKNIDFSLSVEEILKQIGI